MSCHHLSRYGHGALQAIAYLSSLAFVFTSYKHQQQQPGKGSQPQVEWTVGACGVDLCTESSAGAEDDPARNDACAFLPLSPEVCI
jgi:hypothetical protein